MRKSSEISYFVRTSINDTVSYRYTMFDINGPTNCKYGRPIIKIGNTFFNWIMENKSFWINYLYKVIISIKLLWCLFQIVNKINHVLTIYISQRLTRERFWEKALSYLLPTRGTGTHRWYTFRSINDITDEMKNIRKQLFLMYW